MGLGPQKVSDRQIGVEHVFRQRVPCGRRLARTADPFPQRFIIVRHTVGIDDRVVDQQVRRDRTKQFVGKSVWCIIVPMILKLLPPR